MHRHLKGAVTGQVKNVGRISQQQRTKILPGHVPDTGQTLRKFLLWKRTFHPLNCEDKAF